VPQGKCETCILEMETNPTATNPIYKAD